MQLTLEWTIAGFLFGSIPFAVLLGKLMLHKDVRNYGDGNPGGTNAWKAGGWRIGPIVTFLEIFKGWLPVYLAKIAGLTGWDLVPVALAPILGHAFSPFLKFRGGKALGATGGSWLAMIGWIVFPVYALLTLPVLALQEEHALAANAGMLSLLLYAVLVDKSSFMITFAILNWLLVGWKHRRELVHPIQMRPWVGNFLHKGNA